MLYLGDGTAPIMHLWMSLQTLSSALIFNHSFPFLIGSLIWTNSCVPGFLKACPCQIERVLSNTPCLWLKKSPPCCSAQTAASHFLPKNCRDKFKCLWTPQVFVGEPEIHFKENGSLIYSCFILQNESQGSRGEREAGSSHMGLWMCLILRKYQ